MVYFVFLWNIMWILNNILNIIKLPPFSPYSKPVSTLQTFLTTLKLIRVLSFSELSLVWKPCLHGTVTVLVSIVGSAFEEWWQDVPVWQHHRYLWDRQPQQRITSFCLQICKYPSRGSGCLWFRQSIKLHCWLKLTWRKSKKSSNSNLILTV